jgi:hypothetical protein
VIAVQSVPEFLSDARILAAYLIFAGSYVVFALGKFPWMKIDRPGAAIIGAVLMVAFRIVRATQALASIDFATAAGIALVMDDSVMTNHQSAIGNLYSIRNPQSAIRDPQSAMIYAVARAGSTSDLEAACRFGSISSRRAKPCGSDLDLGETR